MNRLTAQEAAMLATEEERTLEFTDIILYQIRKRVKDRIIRPDWLPKKSFEELIDLGYQITVGKKYTITW